MKLKDIKPNPENPRIIKDEKFKQLVKSIKDFPQMLELRPLVVDENNVILGGNMRYRAMVEAGLKETKVIVAEGLTDEQKKEFIIKDNLSFGEWDWNILANEWDAIQLNEWGLDLPSENNGRNDETKAFKLTLEYTENEYNEINQKLNFIGGSKEQIIYNLLMSESNNVVS